jgi:hypothetical protein
MKTESNMRVARAVRVAAQGTPSSESTSNFYASQIPFFSRNEESRLAGGFDA